MTGSLKQQNNSNFRFWKWNFTFLYVKFQNTDLHSPSPSLTQHNCHQLTVISFFLHPCEDVSGAATCERLRTNNQVTFETTYVPFLPHPDGQFGLQRVVSTASTRDWLISYQSRQAIKHFKNLCKLSPDSISVDAKTDENTKYIKKIK